MFSRHFLRTRTTPWRTSRCLLMLSSTACAFRPPSAKPGQNRPMLAASGSATATLQRYHRLDTLQPTVAGRFYSGDTQGAVFKEQFYSDYLEKRREKLHSVMNDPNRFQRITERQDRSDLSVEGIKAECTGKWLSTYRGCHAMKTSQDMVIMHQLLWNLRPATIIELGACTGGSAIWLADMLRLMEVQANIFSMDGNLSQIEDRVKELQPSNVTFLQGDINVIEKTLKEEFLKDLPHPWLVIDDAHANVYGVLKYLDKFMQTGDYFAIEDLNPDLPTRMPGYGRVYDVEYVKCGSYGVDILRRFLTDYSDKYAVDSFYTDFYGYNGTWHWHGYIRRM